MYYVYSQKPFLLNGNIFFHLDVQLVGNFLPIAFIGEPFFGKLYPFNFSIEMKLGLGKAGLTVFPK